MNRQITTILPRDPPRFGVQGIKVTEIRTLFSLTRMMIRMKRLVSTILFLRQQERFEILEGSTVGTKTREEGEVR